MPVRLEKAMPDYIFQSVSKRRAERFQDAVPEIPEIPVPGFVRNGESCYHLNHVQVLSLLRVGGNKLSGK